MKLQWMKDILGESYTEELDGKVCTALGERFVSREDFNGKVGKLREAEAQVTQLTQTIGERDRQLEELRTAAGDNAQLQSQIDALTQQNKDQKAAHEKELAQLRLLAAADSELTAAGARNNTAVRALLTEFLGDGAKLVEGKVLGKVNGETATLASQIEALKSDPATSFLFAGNNRYEGWRPGESGDGKPVGKPAAEMTYSELSRYLAEHPGAKLE